MENRIVGVDIGGTFTDFLLLEKGYISTYKIPSTPNNPSKAVIEGLRSLNILKKIPVAHGSTIATNTLIERRGARTALITTKGFEDILEIGRQSRPSLYDLLQDKPPTLVERQLCFGISERVGPKGNVISPLSLKDVKNLSRKIQEAKVDAVAISLLFSFLNPSHEEILKKYLSSISSRPFISISSEILPEFREYERTSTVTVNSYIGPDCSRYMEKLESQIGNRDLRVMQSSGGSISATQAREQPVRTILSGPAGGVVGAFWISKQAGYNDIITLDMGGTSTDVSVCPGHIQQTTHAVSSGFPISVPMIDIHTVGAGGGSIADIDKGGVLAVGPLSAGANPGPACYGRGTKVTVTDANLLLGRIIPDHFLGGRMPLNTRLSQKSIRVLASRMSSNIRKTALGIVKVVNANMSLAIRKVSLEKGFDPRDFTLVVFGGAGAMHGCELAEDLQIPRVLVPQYPGMLSALGIATADVVKDYSHTVMLRDQTLTRDKINNSFEPLEAQAKDELALQGIEQERLELNRSLDLRYVGQSYELTVDCPEKHISDFKKAILSRFHKAHKQRFGYNDNTQEVELVNIRLKAVGSVDKPTILPSCKTQNHEINPISHVESVFEDGDYVRTPVYERISLGIDSQILGPAIIVQMDATTVLPPHWKAKVDFLGNLIAERR